jgi:hypothetical protein
MAAVHPVWCRRWGNKLFFCGTHSLSSKQTWAGLGAMAETPVTATFNAFSGVAGHPQTLQGTLSCHQKTTRITPQTSVPYKRFRVWGVPCRSFGCAMSVRTLPRNRPGSATEATRQHIAWPLNGGAAKQGPTVQFCMTVGTTCILCVPGVVPRAPGPWASCPGTHPFTPQIRGPGHVEHLLGHWRGELSIHCDSPALGVPACQRLHGLLHAFQAARALRLRCYE